jgi:hypothetical protein
VPTPIGGAARIVSPIEVLNKLCGSLKDLRSHSVMEKLDDAFTDQKTYAFEQLSKGVYESGPEKSAHAHMGLWGLEHIRGILTSLQEILTKRGVNLDDYPGISELYGEIRHPAEQLEAFLEAKKAGKTTPIDEETASIFVYFLRKKLDELREMAREIDEES